MQAFVRPSTIHSHADIPEVAKLGKRKASDSDEHTRPEKKKIMTVRNYFLITQGVARPVPPTKHEPQAYLEPSGA